MSEERSVHWKFSPGKLQRLRLAGRRVARAVRVRAWFPHFPLSLALALGGYLLLWVVLGAQWRTLIGNLPENVFALPPAEMPYLLVGVAMLIMPIGLILRSRLVWIIALALTIVSILILRRLPQLAYPILIYYDGALLIALLVAHRSFDRSSLAAGTLFALTSSFLLLVYAAFGSFYLGAQFSPRIGSLVTAFYYSIVTMSTVGYGDIIPQTPEARLFTVSIIILGVAVFATSISAIVAPMVSGSLNRVMSRKGKRMKRSNHFVIVGATPLAYNTYRELKRRNQPVTLLAPQAPPVGEFEDADVVIGDPNSLDILRKADADEAQAVLAMRADDSENAFVVLAVKELKGKAKTVATINDSKNMERIKLVQPDIVIAPQVLGGELLAMVLSGERISGDFLVERFFHFDRRSD
ncbi:MAG: voltage-gated potassium channel protein [Candidatus Binataceae bacterium]